MILPVSRMIQILKELSLPIYYSNNGFKCHFKDVCIQLTKQALRREKFFDEGEEFEPDESLTSEWLTSYESLKNQVQMEETDSGSFWAGLFLAKLIKSVFDRQKRAKSNKVQNISEINRNKEYSQYLRALEERDR